MSINLKNDTPSVLVEGLHFKFHGQFDHFSSWSYNFLFSLSEQSYNFQKLYVQYYRSQVLSQSCSSYIWNVCLTPKLKCNPSIGTEAVLVNRKSSKAQQLKGLVWTEFILLMNWAYVFCKKSKFSYNISCVFFYLFIFFLQFPWQFKLFTF